MRAGCRLGVVLDRERGHFQGPQPLDGTFTTPFGAAEVSHVCLNDDVVEGLRCHDVPAFSVQYHPEAAAGPHDAAYLFDRFVDLMAGGDPSRLRRHAEESAAQVTGRREGEVG